MTPSDTREAPAPPEHLQDLVDSHGSPESLAKTPGGAASITEKLLPRETGEDIGMGSPVPLSEEAVGVITRLRNMKVKLYATKSSGHLLINAQDEDEDWSRWRDVVFRAKGLMRPKDMVITPPPPQNRRKRGGKAETVRPSWNNPNKEETPSPVTSGDTTPAPASSIISPEASLAASTQSLTLEGEVPDEPAPPQISVEEAVKIVSEAPLTGIECATETEQLYCPECYLPLHPDPKPEKLYIFLHALKYTTSLGEYSTEMPDWAAEGWEWDQT